MTIKLSKEHKNHLVEEIKDYFYHERSEEIGDLAAVNLLDFITKNMGPFFYNQGVSDSREMLEQKLMGIEEDVRSLERPLFRGRK